MTQTLIGQLAQAFFSSKALETTAAKLETGRDVVVGIPLSARPFFLAATYKKDPCPMLVVVSGEDAAYLFARDLASWLGNDSVLQLPVRTDFPWKDQPREFKHIQQIGQRARAIESLATGEKRIVVASARALLRFIPPPPHTGDAGVFAPISFAVGKEFLDEGGYDGLSDLLVSRGYERLDRLERAQEPGTFAMHGDTIDIYPAGNSYPVRVELFGELVEVIRRLVPATGQSIGMLDHIEVYPARELVLNKATIQKALWEIESQTGNKAAGLSAQVIQHTEMIKQGIFFNGIERYLPYFYPDCVTPIAYLHDTAKVALIEPRSLIDDSQRYFEELEASAQANRASAKELFLSPEKLDFGSQQRLTLLSLIGTGTNLDARLEVKHADTSSDERLAASARSLLASKFLSVLGVGDHRARSAAKLVLSDAFIPFSDFTDREDELPSVQASQNETRQSILVSSFDRSVINVADVDFTSSLIFPAARIGLLSLSERTRSQVASSRGRSGSYGQPHKAIDPISLTFPFKPGDYVVHAVHGIALFKEIIKQEVAGIERDYLYLEYAHGDKLFTPVEQIDKVTRYVGPESSAPRLTRLNTSDWSRATGKARKAARRLAFDLVDLYARRSTAQGFAYATDNDLQYEMELVFPYEETLDQLAAIADVKADMESTKPMDRLICGDVGFGKTEVALRAAFKAVQSGKQVMLLCPTTILAQQHYVTFFERFERFAVNVEVLSRFRTTSQQKKILEGFTAGLIDVLVGTHRLLSADVNPRELGLIIIDEEQRFGVQHKEQLKSMREQVDVLTLSATPIPRTMQMAISGVRDMSLIDTPPASRTPIRVHVGEWDEDVVSAAIRREMERHGQVYYVSNRVKSIDDAVARVVATAPEARVGIAHGKLSSSQLETVMENFAANEFDVLVATTIIESGLDNPHTNTLIIEDSQRLGLAQLYQLKGRVGRSHAQAYAYFLFPSHNALTEEAIERLTAIDEFQGLGSGMKIAMRDLEIRGAGSLLGAEQHGMLSAVGFDLFASMLQEAVLAARASGATEETVAHPEVRVDLPIPFFLPEEYMPATDERVLFYRRLAAVAEVEAVALIEEQMSQGFGALPAPAQNLVDRARAKAQAAELGILNVTLQRGKLVLEPVELSVDAVAAFKKRGGLYMMKSKRLLYPVQAGVGVTNSLINLLDELAIILT